MQNPFIYSGIATDGHFCQRAESSTLSSYMKNSVNIVLYSKRRYGKSSLILDAFKHHIDREHYLCIYFDIFDISTPNDFAKSFYNAVAKSLSFDLTTILHTLRNLFSKVNFTATLSQNGEMEFKPVVEGRELDEMMEDIFTNLSSYLKKNNKKAIIAIDEFQQIATIKEKNIEAVLRKYIQHQSDMGFVFCGSKKHLLTQIFTTYSRPFYAQATSMELPPIEEEKFFEFVSLKFEQAGKSISNDAFHAVYTLTDGESWLVQNLCYHLWQNYESVTKEEVKEQIREIAMMNDGVYKSLFDTFSPSQKTAIKAVVTNNGLNLLGKETLSRFAISKSSLTSALKTLSEREVFDKDGDRYYLSDKLFEIWVSQREQ